MRKKRTDFNINSDYELMAIDNSIPRTYPGNHDPAKIAEIEDIIKFQTNEDLITARVLSYRFGTFHSPQLQWILNVRVISPEEYEGKIFGVPIKYAYYNLN